MPEPTAGRETAIEAAARAGFDSDKASGNIAGGSTSRHTYDNIPEDGRWNYRRLARAAIAAYEQALHGEQPTLEAESDNERFIQKTLREKGMCGALFHNGFERVACVKSADEAHTHAATPPNQEAEQ